MGRKGKPLGKGANSEQGEAVMEPTGKATSLRSAAISRRCRCCSNPTYTSETYPVTYEMRRSGSLGQYEHGHQMSTSASNATVRRYPGSAIRLVSVPNPIFTSGMHLSYIQSFVTFQLFPPPEPESRPAPWHSHQARLTLREELNSRLDVARLQALRGGETVEEDVITAAVAREAIRAARNAELELMMALSGAEHVSEEEMNECQEQLVAFFEANEGLWIRAWNRRAYDAGVERVLACNLFRWKELRRWAEEGF